MHKTISPGQKNLVELISRYPGHGKEFKVFHKTWPQNCFYHVHRVELFVSISVCCDLKFSLDAMLECGALNTGRDNEAIKLKELKAF
jgi:hypothetical protein